MERKPGSVLEVNQTTEVVADGYAKIDQKIEKMNQLTVEEDELFNLTQARVLIFKTLGPCQIESSRGSVKHLTRNEPWGQHVVDHKCIFYLDEICSYDLIERIV